MKIILFLIFFLFENISKPFLAISVLTSFLHMAVRSESVLGVLNDTFGRMYNYFKLFRTPFTQDLAIRSSRGVRYGEYYLGRRTLLTFYADRATAVLFSGYHGFTTDYVYMCICAVEPTTGARCTSTDFFICVSETPEYQSVEVVAMFRRYTSEDGSNVVLGFPSDMLEVIKKIHNQRVQARIAAKEARLKQRS